MSENAKVLLVFLFDGALRHFQQYFSYIVVFTLTIELNSHIM